MTNSTTPDEKILFKPLTEGLGLDHFEDGLPYTSTQTKRKAMVQFNFPPVKPPPMSQQRETPTPTTAPNLTILQEPVVNAGFIRRGFAYTLDTALVIGLFTFTLWAGLSLNGYRLEQIKRFPFFFLLFYLVIHMGYFLIQETAWNSTIGKTLMRIRIQSASGFATLARAICFFVAALPFGIGLLWYFFDPKNRCWHDVITDTEVIRD